VKSDGTHLDDVERWFVSSVIDEYWHFTYSLGRARTKAGRKGEKRISQP